MPAVLSGQSTAVKEAEAQVAVSGQRVLGTHVDGSGQGTGVRLLSLFILVNGEDILQIVRDGIELVVNLVRFRLVTAGIHILFKAVERPRTSRRSLIGILPADKAEVGDGGTEAEVIRHVVNGTEVEAQTEARKTALELVQARNAAAFRAITVLVHVILVGTFILQRTLHERGRSLDFTVNVPMVVTHVQVQFVHFEVSISKSEEELHLGTHRQLVADFA